ncbi:MAG: O-antigen ligase family protein [Actinobacteria bacterium]|nr:O-antigen ligase family protein [Actinomycetota bacterium]
MANLTEATLLPDRESRLDNAALLLVCLVLAIAVLFPENFISGLPFFSTANTYPLTLLLPVMALGSAIYIVSLRTSIRPGAVDWLLLLFITYILLRNLTGPESLITGKYVIYGTGTFYLTALLTVKSERLLKRIIYTVVGLVLLTSAYGLIEYAVQKNLIFYEFILEAVPEPRTGLHRIGSTIAHPVPYGAFIIQALPFSVLIWVSSRQMWLRVAAMATTLLAILALFFTYSKGSWLVGVFIALCMPLFLRSSRRQRYLLPAIVIIGVVAVMLGIFWQQVRSEAEGRSAISVDVRISSWQGAIEGIKESPLFGVGLKQGAAELKKHVDPNLYIGLGKVLPVDNYYLSLILEAGIIGFVIWMLLVIFLVLEGFRVWHLGGVSQQWALAALLSILGIILNSVTFESMHMWPNFILFWISAGILHGAFWGESGVWRKSETSWKEADAADLL